MTTTTLTPGQRRTLNMLSNNRGVDLGRVSDQTRAERHELAGLVERGLIQVTRWGSNPLPASEVGVGGLANERAALTRAGTSWVEGDPTNRLLFAVRYAPGRRLPLRAALGKADQGVIADAAETGLISIHNVHDHRELDQVHGRHFRTPASDLLYVRHARKATLQYGF